jgi:sulfonate transport system substrate-binding protein
MKSPKTLFGLTLGCMLAVMVGGPAGAEVDKVRVGVQPGLTHLPWAVIERERLIEKQAKASGLGELKVEWFRFAGGAALNDGMLSGSLDFAETGPPSLIILWAKTRGGFKGLGASGASPMVLVTRNPAVHSIKDLTERDRIAVPAVKTSTQAIVLAMAAEKTFGIGNHAKFDALTVTRSHPDAMAALLDTRSEINSHFSLPPYLYKELETPGVHVVLSAEDVLGAPLSNGMLFTSQSFHDTNPKIVRATIAALDDALGFIQRDPRSAAKIYLEVSGEKSSVDAIAALITKPGTSYDRTPRGMLRAAQFMHRIGLINAEPTTWMDLFFKEAHDLAGN